MRTTEKQRSFAWRFGLAMILVGGILVVPTGSAQETSQPSASTTAEEQKPAADVSDLETKIREQRQKIEELERQQKIYESNITLKRQEALSLKNQIGILDDQISDTGIAIEKLGLQIELLSSEIERLVSDITAKSNDIDNQKERLGNILRLLNRYHRKTFLEITLINETFADFYQQLQYLQTIEGRAKDVLDELEALKRDLELEKSDEEKKREESEEKKRQLGIEKTNLTSQQDYREDLLGKTEQSENQFEALLEQSKQEQLDANVEIQSLEAQVRQRLEQSNELPAGPTAVIWPIPSRRVTAYFHDPTYPFRRYFEHPAVDIGTPQGTPIRAAASGFVARAKNGGMGYSYIMLVHGDGLSTVYGHVSQLAVVEEDFVVQGQIIGYSGGTPGTPGAGRLTTGPHLHFEVRLNGIPTDPLGYLP